ncbi:MAG TPA: hypothetical protein VIU29_11565, partial [Candidatus Deferrimicrobiaceae bacterium]
MIRFRTVATAFGLAALLASAAAPSTAGAAPARAAQGQVRNGASTPKVLPFTPAPALPVSAGPGTGEPVLLRPSTTWVRTVRPSALDAAESSFRAGRSGEALAQFRALAVSDLDDERRGFAWARIGELLLAADDPGGALSSVDNALLLTRARYLVLSAMDLKMRIARRLPERSAEVRDLAGYLIDQKFVDGDQPALLAVMARAEAGAGKLARAMGLFRQAAAAARSPEDAAKIHEERDALIDAVEDPAALFRAADVDEDPEVRGRLYFTLGRIGIRYGYQGMSGWAFD